MSTATIALSRICLQVWMQREDLSLQSLWPQMVRQGDCTKEGDSKQGRAVWWWTWWREVEHQVEVQGRRRCCEGSKWSRTITCLKETLHLFAYATIHKLLRHLIVRYTRWLYVNVHSFLSAFDSLILANRLWFFYSRFLRAYPPLFDHFHVSFPKSSQLQTAKYSNQRFFRYVRSTSTELPGAVPSLRLYFHWVLVLKVRAANQHEVWRSNLLRG